MSDGEPGGPRDDDSAGGASEPWRPTLAPPARPAAVPDGAAWRDDTWRWEAGPTTPAGDRDGQWRSWAMNGAVLQDLTFERGALRSMTAYYPDGSVAARATHGEVSTHECFYPGARPWCSARYTGDASGSVTPDQVIGEELHAPDGTLIRAMTDAHDAHGLVDHVERGPGGAIRFENLRTPAGRELRVYRDGERELTIQLAGDGSPAVAVHANGRAQAFDGAALGEHTRRKHLDEHLGPPLFEASILATPQPPAVTAFVANHPWASKLIAGAPFAHASIASFLTGLTSDVFLVPRVSLVGLINTVGDERMPAVLPVIAELARAGYRGAQAALEALGDGGDREGDGDGNGNRSGDGGGAERVIGSVTLPSGDLVLVDMGAMGQWTHDGPHHADLSGSAWAGALNARHEDFFDLAVTGEDRAAALAAFVTAHGGNELFDVQDTALAATHERFAAIVARAGLRARLERAPARLGHGERIQLLKAAGLPHATFGFAHVNVVCIFGLPTERELAVVARRDDHGAWAYVSLVCKPTVPVGNAHVASLSVEEARFMFADAAALRAWDHERSINGLRDLVFWGEAEAKVAEAVGAGQPYAHEHYFGWTDLPPGVCPPHLFERVVAAMDAGVLDAELRPHSSHHAILQGVWRSPDSAGTAVIGGAKMCGLMSSVGDGAFPVVLEHDATGALCRVTVKISAPTNP